MFRKVFVFAITLLFFGFNIFSFVSARATSEKKTTIITETRSNSYIVDNEGDGNFTTIQAAIDNATNGDIILVYSGNYTGNIRINKTLEITGIDQEYQNGSDTGNPIIWAGGAYLEYTTAVLFSNFSLTGIPDIDKIKVESSNNSFILNCTADYLLLYFSDRITVNNCVFNTKLDYFASINLLSSSHNIISNNVCLGEATDTNYNAGICLQASDSNQLLNNTCIARDCIHAKGVDTAIYIVSSIGNTVKGNICWQSDIGIKIENAYDNNISENNITMNKDKGIFLIKSNNNLILRNNFINNPEHASFKKCKNITWSENYWDDFKFSPKLIFGKTGPFLGIIPWLNFDWRPTTEPFDI